MAKRIQFGNIFLDVPDIPKQSKYFVVLVLIVLALFSSIYTIDANENGVVLLFGKYSRTTNPGIHLKFPYGIEKVYKVKVDFQYKEEFGFRTASPAREGQRTRYSTRNYDNESWMLTGDLNIAEVEWIVQYKIKNPKDFLFNVRDVKKTIRDVSEATMRLMVGDRSFQEALKSERIKIGEQARNHMQKIFDSYKSGISIGLVQLQDLLPPEPVSDSFNEVNRAEQEQEAVINEARRAYNKEIYKVEGEAQKMISEAEGYSIDRINTAKGDAELYTSIYDEYRKAPQITKDRIYIESMEKVLSKINNKIIIDPELENLLPLLNLNTKKGN